tara:strand:- start:486 stop:854 length:369 start_codon:yes stop_codon:yes gene_type:complete
MAFGLFAFAEDTYSSFGNVIHIVPTGVSGTSALGSESTTADAITAVTGLAGTTALGNESVIAKAVVSLTGVSATCETSTFVLVWGNIDTSQTANYSNITTSQTANYSNISTSQTPDWEDKAA